MTEEPEPIRIIIRGRVGSGKTIITREVVQALLDARLDVNLHVSVTEDGDYPRNFDNHQRAVTMMRKRIKIVVENQTPSRRESI